MPPHYRPPELAERPGVVPPVRVDPAGLTGPTRKQARGPHWRRTSHGFYVPADVDETSCDQRIVEAAAVIPQGGGAVTGWAALAWRGARWFSGTAAGGDLLPVQLAMWDDVREQKGFTVCEEGIVPNEVDVVDGIPLTSPARTVCFLMRYARTLREAVIHADMAAYDDLVSLSELWAYALDHSGWTGIPLCREGIVLADENAWSPAEVGPRLVWVTTADLPWPLTNVPVFDRNGRHIATPDLLDLESGLAIEYDGELHLEGRRRRRDRDRQETLEAVGIHTLVLLAGDMSDPDRLAARMRRARSRAPWQPPGERSWTVEPPAWWVPTRSVAARRALSEVDRARLLGYRRSA